MRVTLRRLFKGLTAVGLVALIAVLLLHSNRDQQTRFPWTLEVEMRASAGAYAQLYWSADLHFTEEQSTHVPLQGVGDGFQQMRFLLPPKDTRWLRFDPTNASGEVLIRRMQLLDSKGQVLSTFASEDLKPANQIGSITQQGVLTRLVTDPAVSDPFVFVAIGCLDPSSWFERPSIVSPTVLALATAAAVALLAASIVVIGVAAFGRGPGDGPPHGRDARWRLTAVWMVVLFLVVLSAKLYLMHLYPVTVPFWDQWYGEAQVLYVPFKGCDLSWSQMFSLHNEHRVFFSRLLALDELVVNGQWDPRLQQVVNAVMHSLTAVLMVTTFWIANERRRIDLLVFVASLTFALPFGWENTLVGFQSAFYFLLLFSVLGLWLATRHRAGSGPWFLGWMCAVCGLFTAAGGVALPLAIAAVASLKLANDRRDWRESLITLAAAGVVLGVGIATASAPVPYHEPLRAKTAAEFARALAGHLAWPWVDIPVASRLMWLPLAVLLLTVTRRAGKTTAFERLTIGLGLWVALQAAALSYGRGAGTPVTGSRYQDFMSLGFVANAMALVACLDRIQLGTLARRVAVTALASWLFVGSIGVHRLVGRALEDLSIWRQHWSAQAANVRRFVVTGDQTAITSKRGFEIPFPSAPFLVAMLRDPEIRRILPAAVRAPVRVEPRVVTDDAFVPEGFDSSASRDPLWRAWGSYTARQNSARGRFESHPIAPCQVGEYLEFQIAGDLAARRQSLAVKDLQSGREQVIRPGRPIGGGWTTARVSCPTGPYSIIAVDARFETWFSFREPVEVGRFSPMAEWLIAVSPNLLILALGLGVLAARWT